jgi:multiple sugar transport system ATP-binding protein
VAAVSLERVSKVYPGNYLAVNEISLDIRDHEFLVLVGPSGCGKTTTLRMVAGLEEISSGEIRIGDRVVNHIAPKDRDIAMVFQNYALYPHMTVYKNLAFALKLRKVPRPEIERRVQWAAQLLGLSELLDRRPRALSGGQRQRVAVGRAIVRQPQVFLFDEPLSNLDAKLRVTTRAELKRLQHDLKTTTIYVTHDQEEAMTLGDRVVVMHQGKIQQCGTPLEVYRDPVNKFVAEFVGMPPMNFLEGVLTKEANEVRFRSGNWVGHLPTARFHKEWDGQERKAGLGVRPEALEIATGDVSQGLQWNAIVEVVEILGATMDLTVRLEGDGRFVCRVPTRDTKIGDVLRLVASPTRVHAFAGDPSDDPSSRKAITGPATSS